MDNGRRYMGMPGQRPQRVANLRGAQDHRLGMVVTNALRKILGDQCHRFDHQKHQQI